MKEMQKDKEKVTYPFIKEVNNLNPKYFFFTIKKSKIKRI